MVINKWAFQVSNIRIVAFSTDCDPKYLRAIRLVIGFFVKLPNIHVSERNDVLEVNLPEE